MSIKREGQHQLNLNLPSFPEERGASVLALLLTDDRAIVKAAHEKQTGCCLGLRLNYTWII